MEHILNYFNHPRDDPKDHLLQHFLCVAIIRASTSPGTQECQGESLVPKIPGVSRLWV